MSTGDRPMRMATTPGVTAADGPCIAHLDGGEMIIVPWYGGRDVPPVR